MSVFGDTIDRGDIAFGGGIGDPFSIRRPGWFVLTPGSAGDLAHLSLQVRGKNVRVVVGVGIRFVIRKESDLVTAGAETERVIIERTRSKLPRLRRIDIREPNMRAQAIRERSARLVLDAIDHAWIVAPARAVKGISIRLFTG